MNYIMYTGVFLMFISLLTTNTTAQTIERIEIDTVEIREPDPEPEPTDIPKPAPAVLFPNDSQSTFDRQGYVFRKSNDTSPGYRLTISNSSLPFGEAQPEEIVEQSLDIVIQSPRDLPYQLLTYQNGPLITTRNETIIPTKCDSKEDSCRFDRAQPWTQPNAYGFGYNISSKFAQDDFQDETYFRPFPDITQNARPQAIALGLSDSTPQPQQMTIKIQYPVKQKQGTYDTDIHLVIIPEN